MLCQMPLRVSKWKMFIHSTESLICYLFFAFTISIALNHKIIINYMAMRTHYKITVFTVLDPISSLLKCDWGDKHIFISYFIVDCAKCHRVLQKMPEGVYTILSLTFFSILFLHYNICHAISVLLEPNFLKLFQMSKLFH